MKSLKGFVLYFLILCVCSQDSASGLSAKCDQGKCDWTSLDHYRAMDCKPVYAEGACCPTSYNCQSEAERGLLPNKCYYKGVQYSIGDRVPVTNDCTESCFCDEDHFFGGADISCASVECPSLFNDLKPNCREIYEPNKCCSVRDQCDSMNVSAGSPVNSRSNEVTCSAEGEVYLPGDQMYFDSHPCQLCVCSENYTDPVGSGCQRIDCGLDAIYRTQLRNGCVPVYFSCCFVEWMCPGDDRIAHKQEVIDETQPFCSVGDLKISLGTSLGLSSCETQCKCQVPPLLTCRYDEAKCFNANP